ncbi:hypothetical protein ISU02_00155 [Fusibacter sp. Q10-2]|uniref:Uncharacterized protein n=2 Tax=Fusibacter ferrireducens TaxID=2785058 RepID=A0ABR9ZN14_9FIRM|nr:hypothetical protein [Fusibacter ferrireducens]
MKIKEFLQYSAATTKLDFLIIISSFIVSGIIFTILKNQNAVIYSLSIAFAMMILLKLMKFKKNNKQMK